MLCLIWTAVSGALFIKTRPDGLPVFTIPLGNPPLNGAWLAVAFAIYNAVRFFQYISLRKPSPQPEETERAKNRTPQEIDKKTP